jgi:hypothetical protein
LAVPPVGRRIRFTGKINRKTLAIDRPKLTPEDEKKLMEAMREKESSE